VIGCHASQKPISNQTSPTEGERVTVGTTLIPRTLDPADNYELAGILVTYNLSDTLYTYELGTTQLKPQLATALPKVSEDGLTYTISLRRGVIFHDGTPFNAQAMAFSLERFIKNGGKPSFLLADTIKTVQATGDYELTLTLKQPFSALPALLAFPGACAVSPQAYEIGEGKFNPNQFVGTGPYRLVEFSSDSLRLQAFEKYWGETPKNKGIDLQIYPNNPANLFNAFRTGAVDVAYQSLVAQQVKTLQQEAAQGKWQAIAAPGTAIGFLTLNIKSQPLNQLKVRQAIAAMIDRQFLNQRILQGQGEPLYSLIPTSFDVYEPSFQKAYGDGNGEKAKQLLAEVGYSPENPVTVEIWHSSGSINFSILAAVLKALAKRDLGGAIQFEPNSIAAAEFFRNVSRGIYPTSTSNWYPDFLDADNYIQPFLECSQGSPSQGCQEGGAQNQGSFYYSERMNQLIAQERQAQNPATRKAIFAEIQDMLAQSVPYIPLWQTKDYAFAQNNIKGVIINPSQNLPFWTIQRMN
jgi:peptide/nickel transport system substrate-binding protein